MRCQVGDLALVVRGFPQNIGKLVTCLELVPDGFCFNTSAGPVLLRCDCPIWRIDRPLSYTATNGAITEAPFAGDAALMPIRPQPDEAESEQAAKEMTV